MNIAGKCSALRNVSRTAPRRADRKGSTLVPSDDVPSGKIATTSPVFRASELELMVLPPSRLRSRFTKIDGLSFASRPKIGQLATPCCVTNMAGKTEEMATISSQEIWLATSIKGRVDEGMPLIEILSPNKAAMVR